jgi:hypothetical protein
LNFSHWFSPEEEFLLHVLLAKFLVGFYHPTPFLMDGLGALYSFGMTTYNNSTVALLTYYLLADLQ